MSKAEDDPRVSQGKLRTNFKSTSEHVAGLLKKPKAIIGTFAVVFCALWSLFEAFVNSLDLQPDRLKFLLFGLVISAASTIATRMFQYAREVPDGLENVNKRAQKLAQLQRKKWEFEFAKSVLSEKLSPIDDECRSMLKGTAFVYATPMPDMLSYLEWVGEKPDNLIRLIEVSKRLIVDEFLNSVSSADSKRASPINIVGAINSISNLYQETVDFERRAHQIIPPENLERLHSLQIGWAEPIRDAIQQLFRILQRICDADFQREHQLDMRINFAAPIDLDDFNKELAIQIEKYKVEASR